MLHPRRSFDHTEALKDCASMIVCLSSRCCSHCVSRRALQQLPLNFGRERKKRQESFGSSRLVALVGDSARAGRLRRKVTNSSLLRQPLRHPPLPFHPPHCLSQNAHDARSDASDTLYETVNGPLPPSLLRKLPRASNDPPTSARRRRQFAAFSRTPSLVGTVGHCSAFLVPIYLSLRPHTLRYGAHACEPESAAVTGVRVS